MICCCTLLVCNDVVRIVSNPYMRWVMSCTYVGSTTSKVASHFRWKHVDHFNMVLEATHQLLTLSSGTFATFVIRPKKRHRQRILTTFVNDLKRGKPKRGANIGPLATQWVCTCGGVLDLSHISIWDGCCLLYMWVPTSSKVTSYFRWEAHELTLTDVNFGNMRGLITNFHFV